MGITYSHLADMLETERKQLENGLTDDSGRALVRAQIERSAPSIVRDAKHVGHIMAEPWGLRPSIFDTRIINAAIAADSNNLERLGKGFPEIVACVELHRLKGADALKQLAYAPTISAKGGGS